MKNKKKYEQEHLSILDAVETLADIADMEFEKDATSAKQGELNEQNQKVMSCTVRSLDRFKEDADSTVQGIRETFQVVLEYLQEFYKDEYRHMGSERALEGVKEIMMIAGEAAKKLDRYTTIFKRSKEKSVVELDEYKKLQDFYITRIARKIDQGVLGKWILELTKGSMAKTEEVRLEKKREAKTRHVFIDMDSVKKDTDYDLFFMKKEDGSRFFNPRLIRNIKLVCDFGGRLSGSKQVDFFESISLWEDRVIMESAKNVIQSLGPSLDRYYKETQAQSKREVVKSVNKALMALYLGGNERNLMKNVPPKCCLEFFVDFQKFLREALHSPDYERWIAYPPKNSETEVKAIMDMIHSLCSGMMVSTKGYQEFIPTLDILMEESRELLPLKKRNLKVSSIHASLNKDYDTMGMLMKKHPNGPLIRVLNILGDGIFRAFDPLSQYNYPTQFYSIYEKENKITNVRIPSPTYQEFVHKVTVIEEFKGFLRAYKKDVRNKVHLILNMQDRTSWREHFRSVALENLQEKTEFKQCLTVVTFPKDTEFYEQEYPYKDDRQAKVFIENFKEQLADPSCGFHFPEKIRKMLFPKFAHDIIEGIHTVFFSKMNVLTVKHRREFIELTYLFIQLKILEIVTPDTFSFSCKDAVDTGGAASAQLFLFLKLLNGEKLSKADTQQLNLMLYAAPILVRERILLPNRFNRMVDVIKRVEDSVEEYGEKNFETIMKDVFAPHFDSSILNGMLLPPK